MNGEDNNGEGVEGENDDVVGDENVKDLDDNNAVSLEGVVDEDGEGDGVEINLGVDAFLILLQHSDLVEIDREQVHGQNIVPQKNLLTGDFLL